MSTNDTTGVRLVPFGSAPSSLESLQATARFSGANRLSLCFLLRGDTDALKIPAACPTARADRLWEHTCFEAFIREKISTGYYELNFSPSGEWAEYAFRGYREGKAFEQEGWSPEIVVHCTAESLELRASIDLHPLRLGAAGILRIGLSAVIESNDGALSYWALCHPALKPDFHHPDSFALELAFPGAGSP